MLSWSWWVLPACLIEIGIVGIFQGEGVVTRVSDKECFEGIWTRKLAPTEIFELSRIKWANVGGA